MVYGNRLTRWLYYRAPVWTQNLMCTAYGYRHQRLWQGPCFWHWFQDLQENQWKSTDELLSLQWTRLKELLQHAYEHVPFYRQQWRDLGLCPGDFQSFEDLQKLPFLNKETIREHSAHFCSDAFNKKELLPSHTSGTTGKQLNLWVSRECYEREYSFRWLHYSWSGAHLGVSRAVFAGHPVVAPDCRQAPFSRMSRSENTLVFSSQHLSDKNLTHYVKELASFQPELIEGYPSSLYLLAAYINANGVRSISPRAVYVTSETLLDFQRTAIETAFRCKVYIWYGNTERAGNITECPEGNLHIQLEHAVIEVLDRDDKPAAPGEEGDLVVTGLGNFAFPLIRYKVGDAAILKRRECPCGRGGPLVDRIIGRIEDYIVSRDGRLFGRLDHIFKDTERVREAQIVQDRIDHLVLRIVPRPGFNQDDTAEILRAAWGRLGSAFQIDVQLVESIARGPNNKFRFAVSQLDTREQNVGGELRSSLVHLHHD